MLGLVALLAGLALAQDPTDGAQRADFFFPTIDGRQVLVGDFHTHTKHSDGKLTSQERLLEAWLLGYDTLAITDHGTPAAWEDVHELAAELGIVLVRGLESGIEGKEHLVLLGVSDAYKPRDSHHWARTPEQANATGKAYYQDQLREVAAAGGVVIYPHPHHGWTDALEWGRLQGYIVGLEVLNSETDEGWGSVSYKGRACYPFALDWAAEKRLGVLGNSDIHGPQSAAAPRARTLVLAVDRTPESVVAAIRDGYTLAWFPPGGERWPDSPEMLWATEDVASLYIAGVVELAPVDLTNRRTATSVRLRNQGAVPLEARVSSGGSSVDVPLPPHASRVVPLTQTGDGYSVEWTNVLIGTDRCLTTTYAPSGAWRPAP